jgi:hypothetical protein
MCPELPQRALSVRQPWAELILLRLKTLEIRSRPTKVRGWVQIYASLRRQESPKQRAAAAEHGLDLETLRRGSLLGVAEIVGCRRVGPEDSAQAAFAIPAGEELYGWELAGAEFFPVPGTPQRQPQPSFFFAW